MTERSPDSAIAQELLNIASLHLRLAEAMSKLASLSDQRNLLLRRDMQYNYKVAIEEAQQLFDQLSADVAALHAHVATLPAEVARQIATIEDDLAHVKAILAGPGQGDEAS